MKVLLIRPGHEHMITTNVPKSVDAETGMYPPLGLLCVAAGVVAWTDAEVRVLDAHALGLDAEGISREAAAYQPDVVGIQAMTFTLVDAIDTVRAVKAARGRTHVCLGGPHVNLYPDETLAIAGVDSLVLGEGERPFADLVNALAAGGEASDVPGVVSGGNGEPAAWRARELEDDLDSLPHPARQLSDVSMYWSVLAKRRPITTMMTSRGCPMKCIFCDRPHLGKSFRCRSAANVADEMSECVAMGIHELFLYDDTFSINRNRVLAVCDEVARRGLDVAWDIRARADTLDDEVVAALKKAGVARIHIGVESGSPRILKVMQKGITVAQAHHAFELCRKHRITSLAYFMFGNPTETQQDIDMTFDFLRKCRADYAHIAVTTPFPGTQLYQMGLDQGLYSHDYWREFAADPRPSFSPPAWTENFTFEELDAMRAQAYRKFYTRPGRVVREVLAIRSLKEFGAKARLGMKLLLARGESE